MLHNITIEMRKIIQDLNWMDKDTKKFALIKLDKITHMVGYPEELMNDSLIINEYKDYHVSIIRYKKKFRKFVFCSFFIIRI